MTQQIFLINPLEKSPFTNNVIPIPVMTSKKPLPKLSCIKSSCDIFWMYSLIMRSDSSISAPCSSIAARVSGSERERAITVTRISSSAVMPSTM